MHPSTIAALAALQLTTASAMVLPARDTFPANSTANDTNASRLLNYEPPRKCETNYNKCLKRIDNVILSKAVCLAWMDELCEGKGLTVAQQAEVEEIGRSASNEFAPVFTILEAEIPKCVKAFDECIGDSSTPTDKKAIFRCLNSIKKVCKKEHDMNEDALKKEIKESKHRDGHDDDDSDDDDDDK